MINLKELHNAVFNVSNWTKDCKYEYMSFAFARISALFIFAFI